MNYDKTFIIEKPFKMHSYFHILLLMATETNIISILHAYKPANEHALFCVFSFSAVGESHIFSQ